MTGRGAGAERFRARAARRAIRLLREQAGGRDPSSLARRVLIPRLRRHAPPRLPVRVYDWRSQPGELACAAARAPLSGELVAAYDHASRAIITPGPPARPLSRRDRRRRHRARRLPWPEPRAFASLLDEAEARMTRLDRLAFRAAGHCLHPSGLVLAVKAQARRLSRANAIGRAPVSAVGRPGVLRKWEACWRAAALIVLRRLRRPAPQNAADLAVSRPIRAADRLAVTRARLRARYAVREPPRLVPPLPGPAMAAREPTSLGKLIDRALRPNCRDELSDQIRAQAARLSRRAADGRGDVQAAEFIRCWRCAALMVIRRRGGDVYAPWPNWLPEHWQRGFGARPVLVHPWGASVCWPSPGRRREALSAAEAARLLRACDLGRPSRLPGWLTARIRAAGSAWERMRAALESAGLLSRPRYDRPAGPLRGVIACHPPIGPPLAVAAPGGQPMSP